MTTYSVTLVKITMTSSRDMNRSSVEAADPRAAATNALWMAEDLKPGSTLGTVRARQGDVVEFWWLDDDGNRMGAFHVRPVAQ